MYRLRNNPLSRRKWDRNHTIFENLISGHSKQDKDFFVMQVGANDGVMDDPIRRYIIKYNWRGILVEPQVDAFRRLKDNYKNESDRLIFENAAISDHDGTQNLYKVKDDLVSEEWQRGSATLKPKHGFMQRNDVITEAVKCITFDTLIVTNNVRKIDFLQIDVEGYDYEIIKLFSFNQLKPELIRYEHRHLSFADKNECKKYLKKLGYKIYEMQYDTGVSLIRD
ncbi:MAG: FkbM family methyltransferase [Acidobacteria bacterium]|nr:FkbM family methyltransferase [Acidobacteriota bacterium]